MPKSEFDKKLAETKRWIVGEMGERGRGYLCIKHKATGVVLSLGDFGSRSDHERLCIASSNGNILFRPDGNDGFYLEFIPLSTVPVSAEVGFAGAGRDQPFIEAPANDAP